MYKMNWHITVGKYRLALLDSVNIRRSVEQLADTTEIVLPGMAFGKALDVEDKISRGDKVAIQLGYDNKLVTEFTGYLQNISVNGGNITLKCEDELFNFRVSVPDKELLNVSLKQLVQHIVDSIGTGYTVDCDYDFKYDKFVIQNATGFDVLTKVQEETMANIYLKDNTLHIHPAYTNIGETVVYDFAKNIETDDLTYMRSDERRYEVHVEGITKEGGRVEVTVGTTGGDRREVKVYGVTDPDTLKKRGEEELKRLTYDGYEGSITGWLLPYIDAGWSVVIRDKDYPERQGKYFVVAVETDFSNTGGIRKVELGAKLTNR